MPADSFFGKAFWFWQLLFVECEYLNGIWISIEKLFFFCFFFFSILESYNFSPFFLLAPTTVICNMDRVKTDQLYRFSFLVNVHWSSSKFSINFENLIWDSSGYECVTSDAKSMKENEQSTKLLRCKPDKFDKFKRIQSDASFGESLEGGIFSLFFHRWIFDSDGPVASIYSITIMSKIIERADFRKSISASFIRTTHNCSHRIQPSAVQRQLRSILCNK